MAAPTLKDEAGALLTSSDAGIAAGSDEDSRSEGCAADAQPRISRGAFVASGLFLLAVGAVPALFQAPASGAAPLAASSAPGGNATAGRAASAGQGAAAEVVAAVGTRTAESRGALELFADEEEALLADAPLPDEEELASDAEDANFTLRGLQGKKRKNILFIYVDDLRKNQDGTEVMPNQQRLKSKGYYFTRAQTAYALCSPSRASTLTGRRPDTINVWVGEHLRQNLPDIVTFPQHFKSQGYHTVSLGKIFHGGSEKLSWSEKWAPAHFKPEGSLWKAVKAGEDEAKSKWLPDGQVAAKAVEAIERLSKGTKSWAIFAGFYKPHVPWIFPERFLKMHPLDKVKLASNQFRPKDAASSALDGDGQNSLPSAFVDVARRCNFKKRPKNCGPYGPKLPSLFQRQLKRAYYASATWSDECVGKLLNKLDDLRLWDDTIVVYLGDHGWKLGEHRAWSKQSLFKVDIETPLIMVIPGMPGGKTIDGLAQHIDLAPTLANLVGINKAPNWEGKSLLPLLLGKGPIHNYIFAQQRRPGRMGSSIVSKRWRYNLYPVWKRQPSGCWQRDWNQQGAEEIYDQLNDRKENENLPGLAQIKKGLKAKLKKQFAKVACTKGMKKNP